MPKVEVGMRVRMKVSTGSGWKGTGTIVCANGNDVIVAKDGYALDDWLGWADVLPDDVAVVRDQTQPHAGSMVELVMREWPDLTYQGFFVPEYREPLSDQAERERKTSSRAEMLTDEAMEQFHFCADYIGSNLEIGLRANPTVSSYGLKHRVERWYSEKGVPAYVSNGMFIAAMIDHGYRVCQIDGPNCYFNITPASVKRTAR
jgi:hypothetical protein